SCQVSHFSSRAACRQGLHLHCHFGEVLGSRVPFPAHSSASAARGTPSLPAGARDASVKGI
ncbi:MAG: hypothetical protein II515_06480, partial [Desulfovibrio sp.]|nr:hypothetical protein [Desulfovibrio sp.]